MFNFYTHFAAGGLSERISDWVTSVMQTLGEPGAGLLIALENLFPPLPSEIILPLAGFTASRGDMNLYSAIAWTTAGSVVGAIALYYVGATLGRERTRALAGRIPLVNVSDIDKTEAWFIKHETKAIFFGRMIPIFRSLISIPAGVERMNLPLFIGLTTLGSFIWNTTFIVAGYVLGENWHVVETYVGVFQKIIIAIVLAAAGWFIYKRVNQSKNDQI